MSDDEEEIDNLPRTVFLCRLECTAVALVAECFCFPLGVDFHVRRLSPLAPETGKNLLRTTD